MCSLENEACILIWLWPQLVARLVIIDYLQLLSIINSCNGLETLETSSTYLRTNTTSET